MNKNESNLSVKYLAATLEMMSLTRLYPLFLPAILYLFTVSLGYSQAVGEEKKSPRRGSYLYYGQPRLEDNSMFIEEAFNQEKGVIQHILNLVKVNSREKEMVFSYTEEIPIVRDKHQFSFNLYFPIRRPSPTDEVRSGLGDLVLNYRYMICDKRDVVLLISRASLIVPTGDHTQSLGDGAWGAQLGLALTKRLNPWITAHGNLGYSHLFRADRYFYESTNSVSHHERQLTFTTVGGSTVFNVTKTLNFLIEGIANFNSDINPEGRVTRNVMLTVNPGFRFGFDIGNVQIVPGFGIPIFFGDGQHQSTGSFFYLSLEPDHTR